MRHPFQYSENCWFSFRNYFIFDSWAMMTNTFSMRQHQTQHLAKAEQAVLVSLRSSLNGLISC